VRWIGEREKKRKLRGKRERGACVEGRGKEMLKIQF